MTKKFSMAAGVLYSMQGIRTDAETFYGSGKVTFKTDYINIPIIANVYLFKGLALKFGLQPGFNINAKYYVTSGGYWSDSSSLSNIGVKVKTFDLAIPVGLSYETKYLVLDARYNVGVTKVFDNEGADSRNCVFQFTIGHKFRL
jgi:hypothetical protein